MQAGVNITNGKLSIRGGRAEEVAFKTIKLKFLGFVVERMFFLSFMY